MTITQILALGVRLFAIGLVLNALQQSSYFFQALLDNWENMLAELPYMLTSAAVPLLVALLLWLFPTRVVQSFVPANEEPALEPLTALTLTHILLLAMAFYFFYDVVVALIYHLSLMLVSGRGWGWSALLRLSPDELAGLMMKLFEFIISLALLFNARRVARLLLKVSG